MVTDPQKTQSDKLKEAARELGADEQEKRWEERLKRVARAKDVPVPPPRGPLRDKPGKERLKTVAKPKSKDD